MCRITFKDDKKDLRPMLVNWRYTWFPKTNFRTSSEWYTEKNLDPKLFQVILYCHKKHLSRKPLESNLGSKLCITLTLEMKQLSKKNIINMWKSNRNISPWMHNICQKTNYMEKGNKIRKNKNYDWLPLKICVFKKLHRGLAKKCE